jgi:hypothetical protein
MRLQCLFSNMVAKLNFKEVGVGFWMCGYLSSAMRAAQASRLAARTSAQRGSLQSKKAAVLFAVQSAVLKLCAVWILCAAGQVARLGKCSSRSLDRHVSLRKLVASRNL